jgi:hypothetical protein
MSNASLAGCSILICEDEPLIALGIADAFSRAGAQVLKSGYGTREHGWAAEDKTVCVPKPASPQHLVTTVEGLLRSRGIAN